MNNNQR